MSNQAYQHFRTLLRGYLDKTLNQNELVEFINMVQHPKYAKLIEEEFDFDITRELTDTTDKKQIQQSFATIEKELIFRKKKKIFQLKSIYKLSAAATLLIAVIGLWMNKSYDSKLPDVITSNQQATDRYKNDVAPGSNGAILTMEDNSQILLDSIEDGTVNLQRNISAQKKSNELNYQGIQEVVVYNTISTPMGKQFSVVLNDGTKVWLNAGSSIKFPTAFVGNKREVLINGEVYFEVTEFVNGKGKKIPFIVTTSSGVNIEVLGTHFNISAYTDDNSTDVTLLEGKVKVTSLLQGRPEANFLKPGQQSLINKNGKTIIKSDVDTDQQIAWKKGLFQFKGATIDEVMQQAARWYNIDIQYEKTVSKHFSGKIPRNVNLSELLKILEETGGVKFAINGRTITVLK